MTLLSALLSSIMLDELDKDLKKLVHKFCQYADDYNIYEKEPKSQRERVMKSITNFFKAKFRG